MNVDLLKGMICAIEDVIDCADWDYSELNFLCKARMSLVELFVYYNQCSKEKESNEN